MAQNIAVFIEKIKRLLTGDLFLVLLIVLVGFGAFGLGRLSVEQAGRVPLEIRYPERFGASAVDSVSDPETLKNTSINASNGGFVASVNGTKYHYPWCPGAKQIKESNKITFATREEAEAAGYTPAVNCKGL